MKRTKQSTFARRERSEKSTGFAPVGSEDMAQPAKHTPQVKCQCFCSNSFNAITYCPKHAAAPAMYEALQAIEARLQGVFDNPALMRQGMLTHDKSADVIRFVRAALAQAEGRQGR